MVAALVLGTNIERCGSSSLPGRTKISSHSPIRAEAHALGA